MSKSHKKFSLSKDSHYTVVVFKFSSYHSFSSRAIECFTKVLSLSTNFARAGEIHLRLGVMFKTKGDYMSSMDHFQKAVAITGPASFSRLESKSLGGEEDEGGGGGGGGEVERGWKTNICVLLILQPCVQPIAIDTSTVYPSMHFVYIQPIQYKL